MKISMARLFTVQVGQSGVINQAGAFVSLRKIVASVKSSDCWFSFLRSFLSV